MTRLRSRIRGVASEERRERARGLLRRASRSYIVIILLGIIIGLQIAPVVTNVATQPVSGSVAVVTISGGIDGSNAVSVAQRLQQARQDPDVEAVVLHINSGGGGAAASETMYLAVKRTAAEMPVIAYVDGMAASGAYYAAAPSDEIYVKPASLVGSVGVFFISPQPIPPLDRLVTTGPNKLTGADQREWYYKIEAVKRAFVGAVEAGRGDRLQLTTEELTYAKLYTGAEAVENGMADRIGGLESAMRRAAELADLTRWDVETYGYTGTVTFVTRTNYVSATAEHKELVSPQYFIAPPEASVAPTIVMLPPSVVHAAVAGGGSLNETVEAREVTANATAPAG